MENRNGFKHSALYANAHRTPAFSLFFIDQKKEK
jgi:hypothetical protein